MRPSKTRSERQNPTSSYLSELELKQALQIQALERKKALERIQLQEKAELLKHYENYEIGNQKGHNDEELQDFLERRKAEFHEINPEFEENMPNEKKKFEFSKKKDIYFQGNDYENVNNMVYLDDKQESNSNKAEIERQKRLKLREEERMRRLHGIKNSAYDLEKGGISFAQQQLITYSENIQKNNDIFTSKNNEQTDNFLEIPQSHSKNLKEIKEESNKNSRNDEIFSSFDQYKPAEIMKSVGNPEKNVEKKPIIQDEKFRLKEKQQKYKEELDRQLAQKQIEQEKNKKTRAVSNMEEYRPKAAIFSQPNQQISPQSQENQEIIEFNPNDFRKNRPKTVIETDKDSAFERKKQYAEALRMQINEKNQEKMYNKPNFIATPSNNKNNNNNFNNNHNNNEESSQAQRKRELQRKYREELNSQIQQKNQQKPSKIEMKPENIPIYNVYNNNNSTPKEVFPNSNNDLTFPNKVQNKFDFEEKGVDFLNKLEDEYKSRENKRKDMKQFYQEELKRQIDEKKRMKEIEEQIAKEQEKRELEKIERDRQELNQEGTKENNKGKGGRKPLTSILEGQKITNKEESNHENHKNNFHYDHNNNNNIDNFNSNNSNRGEAFAEVCIPKANVHQKLLERNEENQPYAESPLKNKAKLLLGEENNNAEFDENFRNEEEQAYPQKKFVNYNRVESKNSERYVTYEEFERQNKALKEAIEEKLSTEKLNNSQETLLNNYKEKIKEIMEEKKKHEEEIEKLKNILEIYTNERHVDLDFLNNALQNQSNSLIKHESVKFLEGMQNHVRESLQILDTLPARSNFIYDDNNHEQSFIKDLAIFHAMQRNYFLNESQIIEKALENEQKIANPLQIPQTNYIEQISEKQEPFYVPLTKPQSQKGQRAPKLFQSLMRSNTQETLIKSKKEEDFQEKRAFPEISKEDNLKKLLLEESEVQSLFVASNNLDERRPPTRTENQQKEKEKAIDEEELYENEGFESEEEDEELELAALENEVQMNEAKYQNEEKSLVLADEELDEGTVGKFIESNDSNIVDLKMASRSKDLYTSYSYSSKIGRFKKPKTVDVFGKLHSTNGEIEKYDEKKPKIMKKFIFKNDRNLKKIENLSDGENEDGGW